MHKMQLEEELMSAYSSAAERARCVRRVMRWWADKELALMRGILQFSFVKIYFSCEYLQYVSTLYCRCHILVTVPYVQVADSIYYGVSRREPSQV